jgi:hypothetical protein
MPVWFAAGIADLLCHRVSSKVCRFVSDPIFGVIEVAGLPSN